MSDLELEAIEAAQEVLTMRTKDLAGAECVTMTVECSDALAKGVLGMARELAMYRRHLGAFAEIMRADLEAVKAELEASGGSDE